MGAGPADLIGYGGVSHGQVDVQFNPVRQRWCFLVKAKETISFVWIRGAYRASSDWNVRGSGRSWKPST